MIPICYGIITALILNLICQVRNRAKLERMREMVVRESRKRVEKMKEMIESMEQVGIESTFSAADLSLSNCLGNIPKDP